MPPTEVMDQDEYDELTDILAAAEELDSRLTPWEVTFVTDFQDRVEKWERRVKVSPKQWAILQRIKDKL